MTMKTSGVHEWCPGEKSCARIATLLFHDEVTGVQGPSVIAR